MASVVARAPLRLSFAGGGTDLDQFSSRWGGTVVSAAITKYVTVTGRLGGGQFVCYPQKDIDSTILEKIARFMEADVSLESVSGISARAGLGSSGAFIVAALACIQRLQGKEIVPSQLALLAHEVETKVLGFPAGRQDYILAIHGGFNHVFIDPLRYRLYPLQLSPETILALEKSLILVFVHPRSITSGEIVQEEVDRIEKGDVEVLDSLFKQKDIAHAMIEKLAAGDLKEFGLLLGEIWEAKKRQAAGTSNEIIDAVYGLARRCGALGGKMVGAGGGGYLMLFAPGREGSVMEALRAIGLSPEPVTFDWKGLTLWAEN